MPSLLGGVFRGPADPRWLSPFAVGPHRAEDGRIMQVAGMGDDSGQPRSVDKIRSDRIRPDFPDSVGRAGVGSIHGEFHSALIVDSFFVPDIAGAINP